MSVPSLRCRDAPRPEDVGASAEDFLAALDGPTVFRVPGRDRTRTRALVTLLHGNEPSGLRALHAWFRAGATPAVDVLCVIAAVAAARRPPTFSHRMLPGERDLNRCFRPPFVGAGGILAEDIVRMVRGARPEALIDLHNNTGHNPAYGVTVRSGAPELGLVSLFAERVVLSDLTLGALTEVLAHELPAVTIECGRAGDPASDALAFAGLTRFVEAVRLPLDAVPSGVQVFEEPIRVGVRPGVRLAFAEAPVVDADLTLTSGVDQHNFSRLDAGTVLGWVRPSIRLPVEARGAASDDRAADLFEIVKDRLTTRIALVPIMMTTDIRVAVQDCLFYVVRDRVPVAGRATARYGGAYDLGSHDKQRSKE